MPKAGGKKMTKKERDRMRKEEQQRREREEEAERQRLLEEERKRLKEEKLLQAERKKLENEERRQRRLDMTALTEMLASNHAILQAKDDLRRANAKWARYMRCDGSPDPSELGEINTYVSLKMESKDRDNAEHVLFDSQLDLSLIEELEFLLVDTPLDDLSEEARQRYRETIGELQHMVQRKLDIASLNVLCTASLLQDSETNNLQFYIHNSNITLCIWGNLSKNPRVKSFEFEEAGISFDIPRIMTLSGCGVRFLHTKFDHYSPYSKAYYPRRKAKEEEVVVVTPAVVEEEQKPAEPEEEHKEGEAGPDHDKPEGAEGDTQRMLAQLRGEVIEEKEEETVVQDVIEEDFEDPKSPEPEEWEDFDEADEIVDLRAYHVVGGVFCFDLIDLPPQPRVCKEWIITQMVEPPNITYLDYVVDTPAVKEGDKDKNKEAEKDPRDKDRRDEKPPINVVLKLPTDVLFLEEPLIARWDDTMQYWRTDGFDNFAFDEEAGTYKFSVSKFGPMCLLQDTHINMPLQSWEIRPRQTNSAVLTIIAAISEVEIEIKDGLCCLTQPSQKLELAHMINKMMTPRALIQTMRKAGLNMFPNEDSCKFVSIQNKIPYKNGIILDRMYEQMGLVASSMAFSWSKWNSEMDSYTIVVQGTEMLKDEHITEERWSLFMARKRRFVKLKMTEFDENFSEELDADLKFKSNLYHYAMYHLSDDAQDRINETSVDFSDCVKQLLSAIQVFTYA